MSPALILYFGSFSLLFVGQRLLSDGTGSAVSALAVLALLGSLAMRAQARSGSTHPSTASAHTKALIFGLVGLLSVGIYFGSTDSAIQVMGLDDQAARRLSVALSSLWPVLALIATAPMVLIDRAIQDSPLAVQPLRITQAIDNGLVSALAVCLLFPLNYLASEHNERFDYAYFKTTEVGGASQAIVESLTSPVVVRVFQPASSDVSAELMPYFEALALHNPQMFTVVEVDHAAEPVLAETLKIRDNGYIALTMKDGTPDAVTKSWKVGSDLDKAKRNLKKLDEEFQKRMLDLAKGDRIAYFTVGHQELNWKGGELPEDKLTQLKKGLQGLNFKVKELGLSQGLGDTIPDDADVVVIMAPVDSFMDAEQQAILDYLERGGALLIAVEPGLSGGDSLLKELGMTMGQGTLVSENTYMARTRNLSDRLNIVTNRYSSHASTTTLSKYSRQLQLILPASGWLEETTPGLQGTKTTVTIRSLQDNFADLNGNLKLDSSEGESKKVRPIAMVATGPAPKAPAPESADDAEEPSPAEFRAVVVADSTLFSDLALANQANAVYVSDALNWLLGEESLAGTTESEEDVKIEHSRDDQVLWFYATSVGLPLVVLLLGLLRVKRRRRQGPTLRTGELT